MTISVNTNVSSLNAQRNLGTSQLSLSKSLQRLSSGMRINSAADDAAGMAISNGLTAQVRGLNQAVRNAGDGLSLLGTAEGALSEQTNILQRLRELAVQAGSDTNSSANRSSINAEATQMKNELDRIAKTVQFNGINLLDGSFTSKEIQVGANSGATERLTMDIQGTRAVDLGSAYTMAATTAATGTSAWTDGAITITSGGVTTNIGATVSDGVSTTGGTYSALAKANAINAKFSSTDVSASATTTLTGAAVAADTIDATNNLKINGIALASAVTTTGATEADARLVATAINEISGQTGVVASVAAGDNKLTLTAADGRNITIAAVGDTSGATASGLTTGATTQGKVTTRSANAFTIGGTMASNADFGAGGFGVAAKSATENLNSIDLTTKAGANTAIGILDVALTNMNSRRSAIGAQTNRINITIASLNSAAENFSASNSRILDADFAAETSLMSRAQILQQAGVAILAQANQTPQLALSLLR